LKTKLEEEYGLAPPPKKKKKISDKTYEEINV